MHENSQSTFIFPLPPTPSHSLHHNRVQAPSSLSTLFALFTLPLQPSKLPFRFSFLLLRLSFSSLHQSSTSGIAPGSPNSNTPFLCSATKPSLTHRGQNQQNCLGGGSVSCTQERWYQPGSHWECQQDSRQSNSMLRGVRLTAR